MDIQKLKPAELSSRYIIINGLWHYYSAEDIAPLNPKAVTIVEDLIDGEWVEKQIIKLEYLVFEAPLAELQHLVNELTARDIKDLNDKAAELGLEVDKFEMPKERIKTPEQGKKNTRLQLLLDRVKETKAREAKKVADQKEKEQFLEMQEKAGIEVVTDDYDSALEEQVKQAILSGNPDVPNFEAKPKSHLKIV